MIEVKGLLTGRGQEDTEAQAPLVPRYLWYPVSTESATPARGTELTLPRSRMKQSPLLKLSQDTGTSMARGTRRPLTCKSLCTDTSLGTTCLKPEATPPFWGDSGKGTELVWDGGTKPMQGRCAGCEREEIGQLEEILADGPGVTFQKILSLSHHCTF